METKSRILYLLKLLNDETDENNPLTTAQIIEKLKQWDIHVARKTIAADIALLLEFGIDVETIKSTQNKYYIGHRNFELAEVKLLVDAVLSSKFITCKKSDILMRKLATLVSSEQSRELGRQLYTERIKPENEEIYYTVDYIHNAISLKKQIEFKYIEYTQNKKKIYKHCGFVYTLSPYALAWNEDHYYVIGFCEKHKKISKFRVDRMAKVKLTDNNSVPMPDDFDAADYSKSIFKMFEGEMKSVELKCTNELMKFFIDRFGENVETRALGRDSFKATIDVSVSSTFYSWLFQFGDRVSIVSPPEVRGEYINMAQKIININ